MSRKKTLQTDLEYKFKVNGADVTRTIIEGHVYQGIHYPYWIFEATIVDYQNMWEQGPLMEYPEFSLKLAIDGKELEFDGNIISVSPLVRQNAMEMSYKIQGISSNFMQWRNKRLNKYYEGTPSSILSQIVSDGGGSLSVKKGVKPPKISYIANNITPFAAVQQVLQTCWYQKDGFMADFFIVYKGKNEYELFSASTEWEKGPQGTYKVGYSNKRGKDGNLEPFDKNIMQYAHQFWNPAQFEGGFYAARVCRWDLMNKTWCEESYSYASEWTEQKKKKPWEGGGIENGNRHIIFIPYSCKSGTKYPHIYSLHDKWVGNRRKQLLDWEQDQVTIQISPNPSMHKNIARAYDIDMPSEADMDKKKYDKYMKGKYLLAAVAHHFTPDGAFTNLQFVKKVEEKKRQ